MQNVFKVLLLVQTTRKPMISLPARYYLICIYYHGWAILYFIKPNENHKLRAQPGATIIVINIIIINIIIIIIIIIIVVVIIIIIIVFAQKYSYRRETPVSVCSPNRELKKLRRQLQGKRRLKTELCVKLSLLRLFHVDHVVQNLSLIHIWRCRRS